MTADFLAQAIDSILKRNPTALRMLFGEAPPPPEEELRICCGPNVPTSEILSLWPAIVQEVRSWAQTNPRPWAMVEDHIIWVSTGETSRTEPVNILDLLGQKHGCYRDTPGRWRRKYPKLIAQKILAKLERPGQGEL
jgi:hypothetical protein